MLHKTNLISFALVLMTLIGFLACGSENLPSNDTEQPVSVQVRQVEIQSLPEVQVYSGTVEPLERVRLATRIMGWVEKMLVEEGQQVQKGQLLVKLRSKDLEARLAQAEASLAEAQAQYENTRVNFKRIESLFKKQAATRKELDDMKTAFTSAKAHLEAAKQMKAEVQELLQYTRLIAPFDGVVTRKLVEEGDLASPGQPILEVETTNQFKIVIQVPESDIQKIRPGMTARIQVAAAHIGTNGKSYQGTVTRIIPSANPLSRQFEVQVMLHESGLPIKSGMFARVQLNLGSKNTLLVPEQAVFKRGQLEGLFVIDENYRAHLRWVQTGKRKDHSVEILAGLNPGEQVVVQSESKLLDGQLVEVKP